MNFLEKLDFLMKRNDLNRNTLSQKSGIPYTTIDGFYKKGYENTKLSTLEKLCQFFDVSLDFLMRDEITDPQYGIKPSDMIGSDAEIDVVDMINAEVGWDNEDIAFVQAYQAMPKESRKALREALRMLTTNMEKWEG